MRKIKICDAKSTVSGELKKSKAPVSQLMIELD